MRLASLRRFPRSLALAQDKQNQSAMHASLPLGLPLESEMIADQSPFHHFLFSRQCVGSNTNLTYGLERARILPSPDSQFALRFSFFEFAKQKETRGCARSEPLVGGRLSMWRTRPVHSNSGSRIFQVELVLKQVFRIILLLEPKKLGTLGVCRPKLLD
jgi:hypothetical protein